MFQTEQLQEKWKPLLEYDGLDEIKDPHRKAVTAVLLENQEKFLRDQQSFDRGGSPSAKSETLSGGIDNSGAESVSGSMASYLSTLSAFKS